MEGSSCYAAAAIGRKDMIEWMVENGAPLGDGIYSKVTNDMPWNHREECAPSCPVSKEIVSGRLDILIWLIEEQHTAGQTSNRYEYLEKMGREGAIAWGIENDLRSISALRPIPFARFLTGLRLDRQEDVTFDHLGHDQ